MSVGEEFRCQSCGHSFRKLSSDQELRCPRCGSELLEKNPYLFGTAEGQLAPEDYFDALLAPCCSPSLGWRNYMCQVNLLAQEAKEKKSL